MAAVQIEKEHKHTWLLDSVSKQPDPDQIEVLVTFWQCSDCGENKWSWGEAV